MFAPEAKYGILSAQLAVHQAGREADGRYGQNATNSREAPTSELPQ